MRLRGRDAGLGHGGTFLREEGDMPLGASAGHWTIVAAAGQTRIPGESAASCSVTEGYDRIGRRCAEKLPEPAAGMKRLPGEALLGR